MILLFLLSVNSRIHFAGYLAANEERQLTRLEFVREVSYCGPVFILMRLF